MPSVPTTAPPSTLSQALETRGFDMGCARWTPLAGGRTNKSWRVDLPTQSVVVKVFGPSGINPMFPNDPNAEIAVLRHLEGMRLAPAYLDDFLSRDGHCVVYTHLSGQTWQVGSSQIAQLLCRVHSVPVPENLREAPDGSHAIERQTERILIHCPRSRVQHIWARRPKKVIPPRGRICFLHGDPVPGNIVGEQGAWRLIDWQCPAVGDPCEDIAIFLSPAMQLAYRGTILREKERQAFLATYADQDIVQRYMSLAAWYHWRMAAYCLWLESRGNPSARLAADAEIAAIASTEC